MTTTNVMLVEDHTLMREGIKSLLAQDSSVRVTQEAATGKEALDQIARSEPDVVLMDISLPDQDGIGVTREVRSRFPEVQVVILTMHGDSDFMRDAFAAGASGYLLKSVSREELVDTIALVRRGQIVVQRGAAHKEFRPAPFTTAAKPVDQEHAAGSPASGLSDREIEVLSVLNEGCRTDEIGRRLYISPKTVKAHLRRIYAKLHVCGRLQAVMRARQIGILSATVEDYQPAPSARWDSGTRSSTSDQDYAKGRKAELVRPPNVVGKV